MIERFPPGPAYWQGMCPLCKTRTEKLQGKTDGAMWANDHMASCNTSKVYVWCVLTFARVYEKPTSLYYEFERQLNKEE